MSNHNDEEKVIPLGIVFIVVGVIVVLTAAAIFFVLPQANPQAVERIQAADVLISEPAQPSSDIALLPETPLEEDAQGNFVSAAEAGKPYISGQPERIVIPAIDLDAPVNSIGLAPVKSNGQTYFQWQVPSAFEVGWHNTSAPLGETGNTVLNGHHNIHGEVFGSLVDLTAGAEIIVYDEERPYTYTVSKVQILSERWQPLSVRQENASYIAPTEDERLTLVTCWPYEDNSHRLIVIAQPATETSEK
ncbi:MAG: sortase [Chloroflexi bacterium]|nr:sortase [Chloroflexota bacterium]